MDKSNLIVNYLQTNVAEEDLSVLFCSYGPIQSLKIVRDKATGISMGFGFVNFETNEAADRAAEALNGLELNGKRIKVSVARPAWKANIHSNLYVANLPTGYTEADVLALVGPELAVHIEHVRMLKSSDLHATSGNEFRGVAVARFDTEESACMALDLLCGMTIENPLTGIRVQIHAKPWRPEFRPERAAGTTVAAGQPRRKLSLEDPPAPPSTTASSLRASVKAFVPAAAMPRLSPYRPPSPGISISDHEEALLASSFEQFGALPGVTMYGDRTWGFVRFPTVHAAMAAVNSLTGFNVNGRILELEAAL